jgi:hypothetical protein
MIRWPQFLRARWDAALKTPFGCLLRVFVGRMFHGGGEPGAEELDLGIGVMLILLAMPGMLVSLLMFEKYGSLILFLRGVHVFDPYKAAIPDEYFFIVLSTVVTGAAALWRWDSIFLDRRDYMNLVPLPISVRSIFLANLSAILVLAGLFTLVVNAASLILFPVAVVGSNGTVARFLRFSAGHTVAVFVASAFSFFAVFALAGLLMALLPASAFRHIFLFARFAIALWLLALLASVFTVPDLLAQTSAAKAHTIALLPPVSFLGLARAVWGRSAEPFVAAMTKSAAFALGSAALIAVLAYALSFRRSFLRTPETADAGPLPRIVFSLSPLAPLHKAFLRAPSARASYDFVARTLLRSDAHLQVVLAFLAIGVVTAAQALLTVFAKRPTAIRSTPSVDLLSVPFILSYCLIVGVRFAFEIPVDLRANWIFRFWLDPDGHQARPVARRALLTFSLSWLVPLCFGTTLLDWGWTIAALHTAILVACTALLVEVCLLTFRKIPFTCSYPAFQSHSGLIVVAYLFGFLIFTNYIPEMEHWALLDPLRTLAFVPLFGVAFAGLHAYRKQMLDMDKQLIFEEPSPSTF